MNASELNASIDITQYAFLHSLPQGFLQSLLTKSLPFSAGRKFNDLPMETHGDFCTCMWNAVECGETVCKALSLLYSIYFRVSLTVLRYLFTR